MNQDELNAKIILHKKWLRGEEGGERLDLRNADLQGADLYLANLQGANLQDAYLQDANFSRANLRGANCRCADLIRADLSRANLKDADLRYADLMDANLRYSDLRGLDLSLTNLIDADLRGANLDNADLSEINLRFICGNGREIVTLETSLWPTTMTRDLIAVGCEQHSVTEWRSFSDEEIDDMDKDALAWWKAHKDFIFSEHEKRFGKGE